jgi:hypothetical protein
MGREPCNTSWESLEDFKDSYPSFKLEDKLFIKEGRNVIDAFVGRQYKRRSLREEARQPNHQALDALSQTLSQARANRRTSPRALSLVQHQ